MRTLSLALVAVGIAAGLLSDRLMLAAFAESTIPNGSVVTESNGATWLVIGGLRVRLSVAFATDADIRTIPDSGLWLVPGGGSETGLTFAQAPSATPEPPAAVRPAATSPASPAPRQHRVGRAVPTEGVQHAPEGSQISYNARPPSSGTHYPNWVRTYGVLDTAPATGSWVHNLEHGDIVVLYNCPSGCPDIVQQLRDFYPSVPPPPFTPGGQGRVLIFPYADMDTKIAAVAWGWILEQSELDVEQLRIFIQDNVGRGPECVNLRCP